MHTIYSLDVDGPLVQIQNGNSMRPEMLRLLGAILADGHAIFTNTGRDAVEMVDLALRPIAREAEEVAPFAVADHRLFGIAEKGAVEVSSQELDDPFSIHPVRGTVIEEFKVPSLIGAAIAARITPDPTLIRRYGKEAMITWCRAETASTAGWDTQWPIIGEQLRTIAAEEIARAESKGLIKPGSIRVALNHDALDIQHSESGKELGTRRGLMHVEPLHDVGTHITRVVGIGDVADDYDMIKAMATWVRNTSGVKAVYYDVGRQPGTVSAKDARAVKIVQTQAKFELGGVEAMTIEARHHGIDLPRSFANEL